MGRIVEIKTQKSKNQRRYDLDWLRVLAVLVLVPYHTARIFDTWEPFYAKSSEISKALTYIFVGAVNPWHMPLFFLLAGAATWFALGFRSGGQYVKERVKRLVVPLIFGVLVVVPPQSYLGALTYGTFEGSFFQYYPHFFQIGPTGDPTGYMGGFTPAHLWFILFLFLLAIVALPLFLYLRGERGRRLIARLADFSTRPGAILLPVIPLVLTLALPDIGGKNPFYYLVFFVCGYILMADARFGQVLDRHKAPALILGGGLVLGALSLWYAGGQLSTGLERVVSICLWGVAPWFLLVAILGFGQKYLNFTNRALKYASEAAYPFYILHQTTIVVAGFFIVQWSIGVWPKFLAIAAVSTILILLVYELVVKRTNLTRFLFGMKPRSVASRAHLSRAARRGEYMG